jgi:hypothetical protein
MSASANGLPASVSPTPLLFCRLTAIVAGCSMLILAAATPAGQDKKISIEELVAKHLESIGTAEARAAAKTRFAAGAVTLVGRVGRGGKAEGMGAIASEAPRVRYGMRFSAPEYPSEQMAFDGKRVAAGFLPEGKRSNLALFLEQQEMPLREGLLCGVLSTSWPLLRLEQLQPRVEYKGLSKIEGRQLHKVSYRARKGASDLRVSLYFDPANFHHVRSEYEFQIGARLGVGANNSNVVTESYYKLSEDFDDFRTVDALNLPHKYRLQLSVNASTGTVIYDWTLTVQEVSHRETFDDQTFTIK